MREGRNREMREEMRRVREEGAEGEVEGVEVCIWGLGHSRYRVLV